LAVDPEKLRAVLSVRAVRQIIEVIDLIAVEQDGAHSAIP
jgi:hypothetical protein